MASKKIAVNHVKPSDTIDTIDTIDNTNANEVLSEDTQTTVQNSEHPERTTQMNAQNNEHIERNEAEINILETKYTPDDDNVRKIAIDLGSSNLKIVGLLNNELKFKKLKSKVSLDSMDKNYVVSTSQNKLCFNVGDSLIQQDKTKREYIAETVLLAVNLIYGAGKFNIDLALGLPLDLYKSNYKKQSFENKLQSIFSSPLKGKVNDEDMEVTVNTYLVCAEGYSSFLSLSNKLDFSTPIAIFDMGYRTTDILMIDFDLDTKIPSISQYGTINQGLYEVFDDIQKKFLDDTGILLENNIIESRLINAPKVNTDEGVVDLNDWIKYGSHTIKTIFNTMNLRYNDIYDRTIYLVGGGAFIVNTIIQDMLTNNTIDKRTTVKLSGTLNESIYANAVGYYHQLLD